VKNHNDWTNAGAMSTFVGASTNLSSPAKLTTETSRICGKPDRTATTPTPSTQKFYVDGEAHVVGQPHQRVRNVSRSAKRDSPTRLVQLCAAVILKRAPSKGRPPLASTTFSRRRHAPVDAIGPSSSRSHASANVTLIEKVTLILYRWRGLASASRCPVAGLVA